MAQLLLQQGKVTGALDYFERAAGLARTEAEIVNALSYAEATRTQLQVRVGNLALLVVADFFRSKKSTPNWPISCRAWPGLEEDKPFNFPPATAAAATCSVLCFFAQTLWHFSSVDHLPKEIPFVPVASAGDLKYHNSSQHYLMDMVSRLRCLFCFIFSWSGAFPSVPFGLDSHSSLYISSVRITDIYAERFNVSRTS